MANMHALAHSLPVTPTKRITGTTLGERLREAREAAGLSQDDAGAKIGRNGQTLWRWEHDRNEPSASDVSALASVYGVAPNVLLAWKPKTLSNLHPELRRFLAGPEGSKVTSEERLALMAMPLAPDVEPTYSMYHFFLLSIQAGRPVDVAAESAHVSAEAERRGAERGWRDIDEDEEEADTTKPRRRRN